MPTTMMLHDSTGTIVVCMYYFLGYCKANCIMRQRFVCEEETGHNALLRAALSTKGKDDIAYLFAELDGGRFG